jgi:hypothetical protein
VFIGGGGIEKLIRALQKGGVTVRVCLPDWISHHDLPKYLNQLWLITLLSYTEGLSNIMLEINGLRTPMFAAPVDDTGCYNRWKDGIYYGG